VNNRMFF